MVGWSDSKFKYAIFIHFRINLKLRTASVFVSWSSKNMNGPSQEFAKNQSLSSERKKISNCFSDASSNDHCIAWFWSPNQLKWVDWLRNNISNWTFSNFNWVLWFKPNIGFQTFYTQVPTWWTIYHHGYHNYFQQRLQMKWIAPQPLVGEKIISHFNCHQIIQNQIHFLSQSEYLLSVYL